MFNQHYDYELLLAFAADELSSDRAQDIASHIDICAECAKVVRRFRLISAAMRTDDSREPPPATIARAQAIFTRNQPARASFWQRFNFPNRLPSIFQFSRAGVLILFVLANLLMCGGFSAITVSAQSSIPGDALYPAKLNLESVQLASTWDTGDRVQRHLAFADARANETVALVAFQRLTEIPKTLAAFEKEVDLIAFTFELLTKQNYPRAQLLAPGIDNALVRQTARLTNLRDVAVEAVQPALEHAIEFSDARRAAVNSLSGQPPTATPTPSTLPTQLLEPSSTPVLAPSRTSTATSVIPSPGVTPTAVSTPTLELTPTPTDQVKTQTPTRLVESPIVTSTLAITVPTTHQDKIPPGQDKDKDKDKDKDNSPPGQDKDPPGQDKEPPGKGK